MTNPLAELKKKAFDSFGSGSRGIHPSGHARQLSSGIHLLLPLFCKEGLGEVESPIPTKVNY